VSVSVSEPEREPVSEPEREPVSEPERESEPVSASDLESGNGTPTVRTIARDDPGLQEPGDT
jgi:hypothetical protein